MADYQRVVEYLRDLRQGPLQEVTEEIRQAATDYAALCVHANDRLRKCSTFLSQGLRTEALHQADETPNLLDLVAALDLPDPQAWADFCQNNGLPVPPALQLDRASQLNDAYALDQPLEHLLAQHRLLALSRGPIRVRLALLRQISQVDSGNTSWERDIRAFEKARLKELPGAFYAAVKNRDDAGISSLMREISETQWLEPVPTDLATAVADAFNRMQRSLVETELRAIVEPLREAFAARSYQECQALVQRWKNVMERLGVAVIATDLTDEIRPVIQFIQEHEKREEFLKKFRDSCRAFGRMLDMDVTDAQLEAGYSKLKEFNEPIPEELTQRYKSKIAGRQQAIERKHRGRLIGIGVTVLGLVIVSIVLIMLLTRSSDAKKWADKIEQSLSTRSAANLHQGQQLIDQLKKEHPSFLTEPLVAAAVRHVDQMQSDYDHDTATLQSLLEKFDNVQKTAAPVAANTNATVNDLLTAASAAQDALTQTTAAGDLSWVDADRKLAAAATQGQTILSNLETRASAGVRAEIDQLSAQVDAIPAVPTNISDADTQLVATGNRARVLKDLGGIDDQTKASAAALADKVDQRRTALEATRAMAGELANIRLNSTSADDLKKALSAFVQKYPNDARTSDFTIAIERLPLARDAEAWHDLASGWAGQFAPSNNDIAQKRVDAISTYLSVHPNSPMAAIASSYSDYLKRAAEALAEKGTWQTSLDSTLTDARLSELAYMETSDGQRFYVLGDINRKERSINHQISVTFEAIDPVTPTKRMLVTVDPPAKLVTDNPVPMPHTKVVQALSDQLKLIDAANWDTWGMDAVDSLLKNHDIGLVVKATLVQKILQTENTVAGWNGGIGDAYGQVLTELGRQDINSLPLFDPTKLSELTANSLKNTLAKIPSTATMHEKLAAAKEALFKSAAFDVIGTGVLLKDPAGNWSVATRGVGSDGLLWIMLSAASSQASPAPEAPADTQAAAAPAPTPAPGTLVQIGTVQNGKFALYENAVHDLPQGTMVYATQQ